jgi:hypothetical protein
VPLGHATEDIPSGQYCPNSQGIGTGSPGSHAYPLGHGPQSSLLTPNAFVRTVSFGQAIGSDVALGQ